MEVAELLFATFKQSFEAYESWHLRQRVKLLQLKYDKGMTGIFQDLKAPQRERLDLLHQKKQHTVLTIDEDTAQLHLDCPLFWTGHSRWTSDHGELSCLSHPSMRL